MTFPAALVIAAGAAGVAGLAGVATSAQTPVQSNSGIYVTAEDYASGTTKDGGACGSNAYKVEVHDVLNKPFIDVTRGKEKKRYAKSELFGLRLCDGHDYRFAANRLYRILETGGLYMYGVERPATQGKGFKLVRSYYFSAGATGEVLPLTLENLHRAYGTNHRFIDSLDRVTGQDLAEYDTFHQQFKVSRLLVESATQDR
ncbi:MAG TPA: hypothetical protein VGY48_02880 [Vicinamibacterales bacterium]|jgi:hypothetical protein|nr:hypothetical protein [Vicinamibacterales bacterium]